jgi:23S rRNA (pseudouridine1915-N3)-methyltransferase
VRIAIVAVGRQRGGPEAALTADYLARFDRTGRPLGLGPATVVEVEDRKGGGPATEAALIAAAAPRDATLVALDERGATPSSPEFAALLRGWADSGLRDLAFAIGGADGLDPSLRARAATSISFGRMVWPHLLVRAMLAEQLYRAASILGGGPYHRGG